MDSATTMPCLVAAPIVGSITATASVVCWAHRFYSYHQMLLFVPSFLLLSLPLILVALGLFHLIINALMLKFVGEIMPCFEVPGFWRAFCSARSSFRLSAGC